MTPRSAVFAPEGSAHPLPRLQAPAAPVHRSTARSAAPASGVGLEVAAEPAGPELEPRPAPRLDLAAGAVSEPIPGVLGVEVIGIRAQHLLVRLDSLCILLSLEGGVASVEKPA